MYMRSLICDGSPDNCSLISAKLMLDRSGQESRGDVPFSCKHVVKILSTMKSKTAVFRRMTCCIKTQAYRAISVGRKDDWNSSSGRRRRGVLPIRGLCL